MDIQQKVRDFILENYLFTDDPDALADGDSFLDNEILDSTGIMELIFFLEESFGIEVDEEEMVPDNLDSVEKIAAYVDRKRQALAVSD